MWHSGCSLCTAAFDEGAGVCDDGPVDTGSGNRCFCDHARERGFSFRWTIRPDPALWTQYASRRSPDRSDGKASYMQHKTCTSSPIGHRAELRHCSGSWDLRNDREEYSRRRHCSRQVRASTFCRRHTVTSDQREVEVTSAPHRSQPEPISSFLHEEEIDPTQITNYKTDLHKQYLSRWIADSGGLGGRSLADIWKIREECIASLSKQ